MGVLIGLDVGTTNTKAVAFDPETGHVVAVASHPTPYVSAGTGADAREIDPDALWAGAVDCLRQVISAAARPVLAVGIASMAEAGVPLDATGKALYRIIPWYDARTEPQARRVMSHPDSDHLFKVTGQAPRHVYTLYKILWLRDHEPRVIDRLHCWLSVADFVGWKLTGAAATDFSLASRTMLLDQRSRQWSPELLELAGLRAAQLPALTRSGATIGSVTADAARETGLSVGLPVGIGGHDHLCGALAAGAVRPGQVVDSIGTAEGLVIPSAAYRDDDLFLRSRICCYAHVLPDQFVIQAGMAMSGGGLTWIANQLFADAADPVAAALDAAGRAPAGADRLLYLPYLGGNGSPIGDENVAAAFVGLRPAQERGHLVRAVLEGIAFGIRHTLEVAAGAVGGIGEPIRVVGGGGRSALWLQIRADVLGRTMLAVEVPEAVALGAALLAGVGAGVYPDAVSAAASVDRHTKPYHPDPSRAGFYAKRYREGYLPLYPALAPIFGALEHRSSIPKSPKFGLGRSESSGPIG
ncbi:MAG TPA: FGGY family carbohydrate kinase [Chloroflexota bacterium]|nr:FGGY family carbohydrate kinase [Chloroflexota bacterium]